MKIRTIRRASLAAVVALLLSACLVTRATDTRTIVAPDAGATGFGSAFSMDEGRLVARAELAGAPVVYVFDAVGDDWVHSATIAAPPNATPAWGRSVAVSGDVIAVADPGRTGFETEEYGVVTLYERRAGAWSTLTNVWSDREFTNFATDVWLSGDGLAVESGIVCDATCGAGGWTLFHRYDRLFTPVFRSGPSVGFTVGVDAGRFAFGNAGFYDGDLGAADNRLRVVDANVTLPAFVLDELVPLGDPYEDEVLTTDLYRNVDLADDLLAYESCCTSDSRLHLRRFTGTTYVTEATFDVAEQSAAISVLSNDVVLVADADAGVWHTYARHDGVWAPSTDLTLPDGASFDVAPVAVGTKVAVAGDGAVHILDVDVVDVPTG